MWMGEIPARCDICKRGFPGDVFYDASIPTMRGIWGCICQWCFNEHKCQTGTGCGQKYNVLTGEKLAG